jgi:stage V sporulation protein D (sporulation-specific penicillin-binding protein)
MYVVRKRILVFYLAIFIGVLAILFRLSYVQIFLGSTYYDRALDLWSRSVPVEGRRGNIYDRNGNLIVGNSLAPTVVVIPRQVKNKDQTAHTLARILKTDYNTMRDHLDKKVSVEILKPDGKKITIAEAKEIALAKMDGVYLAGDTVRYYPYDHYAAQLIGITGIDSQGITGIEYIYDEYLRGLNGSLNIYTDAHGNKFEDLSGFYKNPGTGFDIYLTLDLGIQVAVERVLDYAVARYNPDEAMCLVMNPKTSEIYAMASRPTFNPENYQDYPQEVYNRNLPIWKSFEPGSTFKIVTYAAGLEEKVFRLDEGFYDPGFAMVDGARLKDWKAGGHGSETFLQVLQNSCNPGFVAIGLRLGKDRFFDYLDKFGFGKKTGIDLLGESTGIVFNKDKIGLVELACSAFGQGNSVTPIQLMNAAAAAVNGGILNEPYTLKGFGMQQLPFPPG